MAAVLDTANLATKKILNKKRGKHFSPFDCQLASVLKYTVYGKKCANKI